MRKGLYHNLKAVPAINSASQAAAADGIEIDRKGSQGLMFIVNTGAIASAGENWLARRELSSAIFARVESSGRCSISS